MSTLSVSEARATFPAVLDRVVAGDEVTITRHGVPVAVIVRPEALRTRRAEALWQESDRLRELLEQGRATHLDDAPTLTLEQAEELLADLAASRRAR